MLSSRFVDLQVGAVFSVAEQIKKGFGTAPGNTRETVLDMRHRVGMCVGSVAEGHVIRCNQFMASTSEAGPSKHVVERSRERNHPPTEAVSLDQSQANMTVLFLYILTNG